MRPASNSTAAAAAATKAGLQYRNSPIPYLFAGLAVVLGIIGMALIILACSYKKSSSNPRGEVEEIASKQVTMQVEMEPKIVVIMAGDQNPTFLANPVSSSRHH